MRLVMGGESLEGPLTGIGQYTYHLARELLDSPAIEDFKLLAHGLLRDPVSVISNCEANQESQANSHPESSTASSLAWRVRSQLARNRFAVALYKWSVSRLERRSLRDYTRADLYHSPNFFLPEFPGRRVVSILDLSTYRFPEHHPAARVEFVNSHIERAIKAADRIITISHLMANEIAEQFNYPEDRISVTYLAASESFRPLEPNEFEAIGKRYNLDYKGYFLFVSSIEPRKNLEKLIDAYLAYRANIQDQALPLIIAGIPGWKTDHIHARIKELEKKGRVRYLGYVDQVTLPGLFAGARSLLYPSVYEGFGLPVLEAMQAGTAVMTSRATAMAEVGGESVMQVDCEDISSMANAIAVLATDSSAVLGLERAGLDRAQAFSWDRCASDTLAAYMATTH